MAFADDLQQLESFDGASLENHFKEMATEKGIKIGELMLPFRIMLVGDKFGPQVFDIASQIGKEETVSRIHKAVAAFK